MKKFCLRIFVFTLLFFLSYPFILLIWSFVAPSTIKGNLITNIPAGYTSQRLQELKKVNHPDILFLGSSHAYRGFDPRIFRKAGYQVFNLGTSAQKIPVTEFLLRRYLKRIQPKLVVFSIDPGMLRGNSVEPIIDIIYSDSLGWDFLQLVTQDPEIRKFHALALKIAVEATDLNLHFLDKKSDTFDRYIPGGYVENISRKNKLSPTMSSQKLGPEHLASFERCLALIRKNNIPYVLLTAPFTKTYYQISNRISYDSIFAHYGRYCDFNAVPGLQDSVNFYDGHHLNQQGVEKFNKHVIDLLHTLGYDSLSLHN
ncbi:MAG: DUF1574 domain-containing protein [Saprospiraceae bacterium]|nr:DUF1574 domain-containing protein [Saprospiraceae bacterium]